MESIDSVTGRRLRSYPEFSPRQLALAVKKAQGAFEVWSRLSFKQRAGPMKKLAGILRRDRQQHAHLMALEMGKPLQQGLAEIEKCAWSCEFYARDAALYLADEPVKTEANASYISFRPLGIVFAIMPWNFPFWQVLRAAAPALMAGNALVLKHAPNVCGCALALAKSFEQAGFPSGLMCSVFLSNKGAGALIAHPLVRAVTLTGSTGAGRSVASQAGAALKKTVLELGGSDPYLILEDADLDYAASTCAASRLINSGQSCIAAKRFIIMESVYEKFTARFLAHMQNQQMGNPLQPGVTIGPLARLDLREHLHAQVSQSVRRGAKLLMGGVRPPGPGAYYPPTVLADARPGMPAYTEELFGPVAVLWRARSLEQAVNLANATSFGLGAAVFTANRRRGERIARQELNAGCCFVNDAVKSDPRLPFGGVKDSGYGRELAHLGIREFVNAKTVYVA